MKNTLTAIQHSHARRLIFGLILLSLAGPVGGLAQDTTRLWSRPNVLKTNLLAPVSVFYERALTRRFALRLSARALKLPRGTFNEQTFINATVEGKFYTARLVNLTAKGHPTGFFVNPYLKARSLRVNDHVRINPDVFEKETIKSVGFGVTIGYQWVSRRGFVVEIFHGFGGMPAVLSRYRRLESDGTVTTRSTNDYLKMDWRAGVSLGYAF
ncbi:DUF3575 domain-containing protein [Spirosoma arcticum]